MATRIPFDELIWQDYLSGQMARLPPLSEVQHITERVICILGHNPGPMSLQGTNTYLVGTGSSRILIDTGEGNPVWIKQMIRLLGERQLTIAYVLLTHWHGDHTGGVADLIAHNDELSCRIYKNQPDPGQNSISDGQTFRTEGATIRAVHTPGHAVDHMCFVLEEENALFTGDNVLGHGYSVVSDLSEYMKSLARMDSLKCVVGYPGHGASIENMADKMKQYIQHKECRIQQVFSTLCRRGGNSQSLGNEKQVKAADPRGGRRDAMTLLEIVESIYGDVPAQLVQKALAPFLTQVLWKLAEDQKVGFEPGEPDKKRWFVCRQARRVKAPVTS